MKGGWTASIGLGNFPWSVLLIKRATSRKKLLNSSYLATDPTVSVTHLAAPAETLETSMDTGTFEPSLARSTLSGDQERTSFEGTMVYSSREGTDELASEVAETGDLSFKSSDIQPDNAFITQDPAEKDTEDG